MPEILNPLSTLVAAFAGSWAAFRFQRLERMKDEDTANVAAGNRALIVLLHQLNTLKMFQMDFLEPVRNSPLRHLQILPTLPYSEDFLTYDVKTLDFLIPTGYASVLLDLTLEEHRFKEAIKTINFRSTYHLEVIQPKLASSGISDGGEYTQVDFQRALGDFDYIHLKKLTDAAAWHVDSTVESLSKIKDRLQDGLKSIYPRRKFIKLETLKDPPKSRLPDNLRQNR